MEKAYDVKDLAKKLQEAGLPIAEQVAELVLDKVLVWLKESAAISKNAYDDIALVLLPVIEEKIKAQINKIDKQEG